MKSFYLFTVSFIFSISSFSQKRILVYHETNGFTHGSIGAGISMFEDLGDENGDWVTDNSDDSSVFTPSNLAQYDAVVFLNTSGSDESGSDGDLLSASEKLAFENFIASGKGFIGVHAATDTCRDGVWPFYNELVGGIVQTSPNHTSNNFNADMTVEANHPAVDFLGSVGTIWNKNEEYYYWQNNGGQLSNDNTVLLEVESTGSNSYDAARPITWYKESLTYDNGSGDVTVSGFKSFYTALGHNSGDYNSNTNFRTMIKNATLWAIGELTLSVGNQSIETYKIHPNPAKDYILLSIPNSSDETSIAIYDSLGKNMLRRLIGATQMENNSYRINIQNFRSGIYIVSLNQNGKKTHLKLIKD
ncbi:MAG: T9SS type A sorting domain-containing protein [Winogradskyella sp.]|nr:MAG: T9SS type A sorting domain-containing protein [Winogradskyella sp.]